MAYSNDPPRPDLGHPNRPVFVLVRPSSRAAFLFSWNGPIFRGEFEKTLDKTEVLMGRGEQQVYWQFLGDI